tara:strand:+ start:167 stop:838 length:672 start_codon:yes stop_codon:yes gene_type:complete
MAVNLKNTSVIVSNGLKFLLYGTSGVGKTYSITTMPNPVILSAEAGLLSIKDSNLPFIEIDGMNTLREAYKWLTESEEAKKFDSVALDSISEMGEVCLTEEKEKAKDPRAAYGEMQAAMAEIIRSFRDLPGKHVLFTAKLEKSQDETGRLLYSPSMPGNKTGQALPYYFDIVAAMRLEKDGDGVAQRALMCDSDGLWQAKDRSGKLDAWETPDIGAIIKKIGA